MNKTNIILRSLVVVTLISSFIAVLLSSLFPIVTYGAQTGGQDHPPKVPDLIISTNGTRPLKLNFNGSDPDRNDRLKFFILQRPINGLLSNVSGNSSTYTPNPGFTGLDK